LRGAATVWLLARGLRKQDAKEDPDAPGMVSGDERSRLIFARARELAREGREDGDAVDELRALAGRHQRSLRRAEERSRIGGQHLERRRANDIHRLLQAALRNRPVEPPSPADVERFATLEHLFRDRHPDGEVWADLVVREPKLAELAADVRSGRYGLKMDDSPTSAQLGDPEYRRQLGESARLTLELFDRVKQCVGPLSRSADPVITSRAARDIATSYLYRLRPSATPQG
jgi:hypothetical protein